VIPIWSSPIRSPPHLDDARAALGDQAWEKAWAAGAELDLDAALTLALEQLEQQGGQ
jgi:hypothetical protein